jgi:hypothetical protein
MAIGIDINSLLTISYYGLFFVFIAYGQRIQYYITSNSINKSLKRLNVFKEKAIQETTEFFLETDKDKETVRQRIGEFLEYVTIMPESMDPAGIVNKLALVTRTGDERVRNEVHTLLKDENPVRIASAQNLIEISGALNMIHKVVRHFYLTGKKTNSYVTLLQLQMVLPQILEQAGALAKATDAFRKAQPIGDGAGALVAAKLIGQASMQTVARDTVMGSTMYKGRTLYVLKAEGPMGYVGDPGVAFKKAVEEMKIPLKAIIMIDAALKLEGEKTGEIAEGVGAAIGGIGVEKYQIEQVATQHNIPIFAVLIKESDVETMTAMKEEIAQAAERAIGVIDRVLEEKTKEGDVVLLAGIGNTLGIGQSTQVPQPNLLPAVSTSS